MDFLKKWGLPALWGAVYGIGIVLLSRWLLRSLGQLTLTFGGDEALMLQVSQALGQLRSAVIRSPWVVTGAVCAAGGCIKKPWVYRLGAILLLPGIIAVLCFTTVNSIRLLELLRCALPLLAAL